MPVENPPAIPPKRERKKKSRPVLPIAEKLALSPWMELPKTGSRCPYTNLNRALIERLTRPSKDNDMKPIVKSTYLKTPGSRVGTPMFHLPSMLEYLEQCSNPEKLPPLRSTE